MRALIVLTLVFYSIVLWPISEAKSDYYSEGENYSCKDLAQKFDLAMVNAKRDDIRRLGVDPDTDQIYTAEQRDFYEESYEWHRNEAAALSQIYLVFCTKFKHLQNEKYLSENWE